MVPSVAISVKRFAITGLLTRSEVTDLERLVVGRGAEPAVGLANGPMDASMLKPGRFMAPAAAPPPSRRASARRGTERRGTAAASVLTLRFR